MEFITKTEHTYFHHLFNKLKYMGIKLRWLPVSLLSTYKKDITPMTSAFMNLQEQIYYSRFVRKN